jgi:hypothetical protein
MDHARRTAASTTGLPKVNRTAKVLHTVRKSVGRDAGKALTALG